MSPKRPADKHAGNKCALHCRFWLESRDGTGSPLKHTLCPQRSLNQALIRIRYAAPKICVVSQARRQTSNCSSCGEAVQQGLTNARGKRHFKFWPVVLFARRARVGGCQGKQRGAGCTSSL
eukprot:6186577-Pleurochrysis_carterae.AAC.2